MKYRLLTPGPTPVPEETLLDLARPVFFHRSPEFKQALRDVTEALQHIYCTKNPVVTLTCSGTGGMEAAVSSTFAPGEKVICLISGRWGERWRNIGRAFGLQVISVTVPYGQAVTPEQLAQALAEHPDAVGVCSTLCETATGVVNDIEGYGKIVAKTSAVLLVDGISGLGAVPCRTDDWGVDLCVAGSQKALMLPPGLAFISVSEKAAAKIQANTQARTFYFDLRKYLDKIKEFDTPYTPANTLIRALVKSVKRLRDEGIENVWARHEHLAAACRAGVTALGMRLFAERPASGMTVFAMPEGVDSGTILSKLEKQYNLKLANGQDTLKGKIIRLSHMGFVDRFDVLAALAGLELVLAEIGQPVQIGAAVAAFQRTIASRNA
jgi:aspartate aminotransferase-like enzyme